MTESEDLPVVFSAHRIAVDSSEAAKPSHPKRCETWAGGCAWIPEVCRSLPVVTDSKNKYTKRTQLFHQTFTVLLF